ncbi:MAG TPA: TraR/DksA family transcriptional regulator [Bacteroidetes bacterium]|nr:TraR/DksA family transcriptional regulator [Bacteroidota bacterium]
MTPEEQLQLKEKIEKHLIRTRKDAADLKELTKPIELSNTIGRLTRMDAINNKSVNEAALREVKEKLRGLEYSLAQYGSDKFGKCVNCGNEIPFGRLCFLPASVKCVKCAR